MTRPSKGGCGCRVTLFLFVTLAGMRLGWLLIEDQLTRRPREWVIDWSLRHTGTLSRHVRPVPLVHRVLGSGRADRRPRYGFGFASFPLIALWPFAVNMVAAPIPPLD